MHEHFLENLLSQAPGVTWPAVPGTRSATMQAVLAQMKQAETMPAEWIASQQQRQLALLAGHALDTVPLYRQRLNRSQLALLSSKFFQGAWRQIPVLTRDELQSAGERVLSTKPPPGHEVLNEKFTSGSTGTPVKAYSSVITQFFWSVNNVRDHLWHRRDINQKIMAIRPELALEPGNASHHPTWGPSFDALCKTGPMVGLNVRTPVDEQIRWIEREKPTYLLSLPTNLRALVQAGADFSSLKGLLSYGELLDDATRDFIEQRGGVPVSDGYSSQEVGYITLMCPEARSHHILSDSVLLEVIDDDGRQCRPGETGRVVVTQLHNLTAPLIRYAIGDYAVVGEPCPCGRTFPVLAKILGRKRNMVTLPDGRQHWPSFPADILMEILPVRQFQLVQEAIDRIDVNLVVAGPVSTEQEQQLVAALQKRLTYPFSFRFHYLDQIPRSKGGKFEDFISRL